MMNEDNDELLGLLFIASIPILVALFCLGDKNTRRG